MAPLTFEEFKSYFEFTIELASVGGAIATAIYKFDCVNAIWAVARGRANSADHTLAVEVLQGGGGVADQIVRRVAIHAEARGHQDMANRLEGLREEVQGGSRAASPGEMV